MIKAVLFKNSVGFTGFELSGHSGYAEQGSDIVCAATSACAQFAIAGIVETEKISCGYEITDGRIFLTLPASLSEEERKVTDGYIRTLECMLSELSRQFNDYLNFTVMEV